MADAERLQDLIERASGRLRRAKPEATYRLQLHKSFTFQDAKAVVGYLRELGVTHAYASPYLKARPGSTHGYDIVDPSLLNPEIGTEEDYRAWISELHTHGIGQLADIVPNHVGVLSNGNSWWNDVVENGPSSEFANWFDISWQGSPRPDLKGRLLLPVLGEPYGEVLEKGGLTLVQDGGGFEIRYADHRFPIDPSSYAHVLGVELEALQSELAADDPPLIEYLSILASIDHLPPFDETDGARVVERQREKDVIKRRIHVLTSSDPRIAAFVGRNVKRFAGKPGDPKSFDRLDQLLSLQPFRLSHWRVASDEINYRRFFDVNSLAALRSELPEVFEATHELMLGLLAEGAVDGLRIDHPDGLLDPEAYLMRLQQACVLACARKEWEEESQGKETDWFEIEPPLREWIERAISEGRDGLEVQPAYIVVEKILGTNESLPNNWPTSGTTGYEILNIINGLFVDGRSQDAFARVYQNWIGDDDCFYDVVYQKKKLILEQSLASELHMLAHDLDGIAQKRRNARDFTLNSLRNALLEVIACFPVYRSYISQRGASDVDRLVVEHAIGDAQAINPSLDPSSLQFLESVLLSDRETDESDEDRAERLRFAGKFQQVTSPVMAKGVEDTAFYVYNRLASLNEVGGDPGQFGLEPEEVHRRLIERQSQWPRSLSPLSTHDTKRGEDVRARINILSETPDDWAKALARWSEWNSQMRSEVGENAVPGRNEEWLLYQTLLGVWPAGAIDQGRHAEVVERVKAYFSKALREAKVHTSWAKPNPEYEEALSGFIGKILDPSNAVFLEDFRRFHSRIAHLGLLNSLSQTLLHLTAPGVPDVYQGSELWDFRLVDPDNRQPVDFEHRRELLANVKQLSEAAGADCRQLVSDLLASKVDGRVKLYVIWRVLLCRRDHPGLFCEGSYIPLEVVGDRVGNAFGYVRSSAQQTAIVVLPRMLGSMVADVNSLPLGTSAWGDSLLRFSEEAGIEPGRRFRDVFTGSVLTIDDHEGRSSLALADLFARFPLALLLDEERK